MGLDISFAISDANGLPRLYRRFGEALVLSITLVPYKAYTSAITQLTTEDLADLVVEGAALQGINRRPSNNSCYRWFSSFLQRENYWSNRNRWWN